jgi:ATP-dependent helicase HrpB
MSLPILEYLPQLRQLLAKHSNVILQAEPGAGKTTQVPLDLLDASWLAEQRILMLEPRRLAARSAATYMAEQRGEEVGQSIGYRTRMDSRVSAKTRLEVVTEGILTRLLQQDPALEGYGLLIFDEFHERSLQADLGLALCLDAQRNLREDLKLLVMSATLDVQPLQALLDDALLLQCPGRQYPVEMHYRPANPRELFDKLRATVLEAIDTDTGSVLVFLPGSGEIRRLQQMLEADLAQRQVQLNPLYGDLSRDAQWQAIAPCSDGLRKVVLATNIAETSLTIEGIRIVVDSGLAKVSRFHAGSGLSRLQTMNISQASAAQRCGRAGRLEEGACYRLWSEAEQDRLLAFDDAEIKHADLLPLVLELAQWGVKDVRELSWLDVPAEGVIAQARMLAQELALLDNSLNLSSHGQEVQRLGLHPRLGHMLVRAKMMGLGKMACELAALLSERSVLRQRSEDLQAAYQALQGFKQRKAGSTVDAAACKLVLRSAQQYARRLGVIKDEHSDASRVGILLALAYPDRIAGLRSPQTRRYLLSGGKGAVLHERSDLPAADYFAIAHLGSDSAEPYIQLAAPLLESEVFEAFPEQIELQENIAWDKQAQAVVAEERQCLGNLVLSRSRIDTVTAAQLQQGLLAGIRSEGVESLPWTNDARSLCQRVQLLSRLLPEQGWPDMSESTLLATMEDWLAPFLNGMSRLSHLKRVDMKSALQAMLPWDRQQLLDELAPTHFEVPTGSRIRIDYSVAEPVLAVRLQEMYGCDVTPTIAQGRQPLTLHLLSPAMRPAQVTQDLVHFWQHSYVLVKKDLKGRYPKHYWPDDPLQAQPLRGTKRNLK